MPEICLIPASGECIHINEAKNDRRVDFTNDDSKIKSLIAAAQAAAESITNRQFLHARFKYVLDAFPRAGDGQWMPLRNSISQPAFAIRLPHSPVVNIISVQYLDMNGGVQTMAATDYVANVAYDSWLITPAFGKVWPITLPQIGSVWVIYNAGYASPMSTGGTLAVNQFSVAGPVSWNVGDSVKFYNSGGALPAPLDPDASYVVATAAGGIYSLTDAFGAPVNFTAAGVGRSFIGVVPDGLRSWMLLRVGTLYEQREEVAVMSRGKVDTLPYIARLLDPYIVTVY